MEVSPLSAHLHEGSQLEQGHVQDTDGRQWVSEGRCFPTPAPAAGNGETPEVISCFQQKLAETQITVLMGWVVYSVTQKHAYVVDAVQMCGCEGLQH